MLRVEGLGYLFPVVSLVTLTVSFGLRFVFHGGVVTFHCCSRKGGATLLG